MKTMKAAASVLLCVAALALLAWFTEDVGSRIDDGGPGRLEDALRESATACYATEGRYPDSVDYLIRHYGVRPDGRYEIHYSIFASNIPPEIAVTVKRGFGNDQAA